MNTFVFEVNVEKTIQTELLDSRLLNYMLMPMPYQGLKIREIKLLDPEDPFGDRILSLHVSKYDYDQWTEMQKEILDSLLDHCDFIESFRDISLEEAVNLIKSNQTQLSLLCASIN